MARKKKHPEHVNHERWLISYADFITLLFAFFVVMFATSRSDSVKVGRFTEAFRAAAGIMGGAGDGVLPGATYFNAQQGSEETRPKLPEQLEDVKGKVAALVAAAGANGPKASSIAGLKVIVRRNELVLRMPESIVFESGADFVKESADEVLKMIVQQIGKRPLDIRVEGHSDERPIRTERFHSNWDLSSARATAIVEALVRDHGVAPERCSAAGYGEFHPIASNATAEGRALNRRVDIVLAVSTASDATETETSTKPAEKAAAPAP